MDPLNSTVGSQIQTLRRSRKGVKIISYDRATFTGTNTYYVSFDNVQVGKLIGTGLHGLRHRVGREEPAGLHAQRRREL